MGEEQAGPNGDYIDKGLEAEVRTRTYGEKYVERFYKPYSDTGLPADPPQKFLDLARQQLGIDRPQNSMEVLRLWRVVRLGIYDWQTQAVTEPAGESFRLFIEEDRPLELNHYLRNFTSRINIQAAARGALSYFTRALVDSAQTVEEVKTVLRTDADYRVGAQRYVDNLSHEYSDDAQGAGEGEFREENKDREKRNRFLDERERLSEETITPIIDHLGVRTPYGEVMADLAQLIQTGDWRAKIQYALDTAGQLTHNPRALVLGKLLIDIIEKSSPSLGNYVELYSSQLPALRRELGTMVTDDEWAFAATVALHVPFNLLEDMSTPIGVPSSFIRIGGLVRYFKMSEAEKSSEL